MESHLSSAGLSGRTKPTFPKSTLRHSLICGVLAVLQAAAWSVRAQSNQATCDVPPAGLVDWWQAEGNATDSIGTNNGTLNGTASFVAGEVGQAFSFDGTTGYVSIPDSPSLDSFTNAMTIELWMKSSTSGNNADWKGLVTKGNESWKILATTFANTVYADFFGVNPPDIFGTRNVNDGQWHHVAATYDGTTMSLYVDGVLDGSHPASGPIAQDSLPLYLGGDADPPLGRTYLFGGQIDEVSLFNRALSAAEIAAIYNAGSAGKCFVFPPTITVQPTNLTVTVGGTATFSVQANGAPPLFYQWNFGGTNIQDATNSTLTLTNIQLNQAGDYSVSVSNSYNSTNSSPATLTVNPAPLCYPQPPGLVNWWRAEGDATDSAGTNNGSLQGSAGFVAGEVGQAFSVDGVTGYVSIPDAPALDSFTNAITIELWMKSANTGNNADWEGLVTKGNTSWRLMATTSAKTVYLGLSGTSSPDLFGTRNVNDGQWHHVAATYDGSTVSLYVDGTLDVSHPAIGQIAQNGFPLYIGGDSQPPQGHTYLFSGALDEVSLYSRALSAGEIAAIYNEGSASKCVGAPPFIIEQPTNQMVNVGQTTAFTAQAIGAAPLSYQWSLNGTNIQDATNTTITLTNVQLSAAGSYAVAVSNLYGATNSVTATLTVNSLQPCDPPAMGLVNWWRAEANANDTVGTDNGTLNGTAGFVNGEVGQAFTFDGTSGYVSIPDSAPLDSFTNAMTIELWMRSATIGNNADWVGLVSKGNESWRLMGRTSANTADVAFNGVTPSEITGTRNVNDGQWHHIAGTYDGNRIALYVDGTLDASVTASGTIAQLNFPVYIGGDSEPPAGHTYLFNGQIDEVSLYNRALSSDEIAAIYNAGNGGKCVSAPPSITSQPTNETVHVGDTATFAVVTTGTPPLSYQWSFAGAGIQDATNATLVLTNVQLSQAGGYSVLVSNAYGFTNSVTAALTVNVPVCAPQGPGLVNWWQAEGNANDSVGPDNGTLQGTAGFVAGEVGQAFSFDGTSGFVSISNNPSLNVFSNNMTIELWMKSATIGNNADWAGLVTKGNQSWRLMGTASANTADVAFNGVTPSEISGTRNVNDGQWHHIAGTYNGSQITLYVDGALDASVPASGTIAEQNFPVYIGGDSGAPAGHTYLFHGQIDEVSLYNRALSSDEIAAIYNASRAGKCSGIPPTFTIQPIDQSVLSGTTVGFSVSAAGTSPLSYQWSFGGVGIQDATNATLLLTNVQPGQSGGYSVVVSNAYGFTNSVTATLTVTVPSCSPPPAGIVNWWQAEGDATDSAGTNGGTLQGTASFVAGEVGQAFSFDGTTGYVSVPDAPALDSLTNAITIELWMKSANLGNNADWEGLVTKGNTSWRFMATTSAKTVYLGLSGTSSTDLFGTRNVNDGQWHHVAATYDGSTASLYVDGTLDVSHPASGQIAQNSLPLYIGGDSQPPSGHTYLFKGSIDEVSLYNRALSSNEIAAIYNAGALGKCALPLSIFGQPASQTVASGNNAAFTVSVTGTAPRMNQWWTSTGSIPGATNATLIVSNVQAGDAGFYYVIASNSLGSVTSSNALLTVTNEAPFITTPPQGTNLYQGTILRLSVAAGGSLPLGYQWIQNTNPIAGATNALYTKTNAQTSDAGNYTVIVSNAFGSVTSSVVSVTVTVLPTYVIDDFEPDIDQSQWSAFTGSVLATNFGGFVSPTHSLWFGGPLSPGGTRSATTHLLNMTSGGPIQFYIRLAFGTSNNWKTPSLPRNGVNFEYSTNLGTTWIAISQYTTLNPYTNWTSQTLTMPQGAMTPTTLFRWRQTITVIDSGTDNWAIDDVNIGIQPPQITTQPTNQTVTVGQTATFSVSASGTAPLYYQWSVNNSNILNATNATLTLTNVQLGQAGSYSVLITNAVGSINSTNATLTVNSLLTCDPPPTGLVDWWRAEGDASDSVGTNNGTLNGSAGFAAGEVGQAFSFNGINSYVSIPDSPSLDSLSNAITIEAWMKSASTGNNPDWKGLVTKGNESWRLMASVFTNTLYVGLNGVTPVDLYGSRNVNDGQWHHVAATYDGSKIALYVDGTLDTSVAATGKIARDSFPLYISGNSEPPSGHTYYFNGLIDEVSLYNRALSSNEIAAIYNAGTNGKCVGAGQAPVLSVEPTNQTVIVGQTATFSVTASGTAPLHYQWSVNSSNILNATNATLTLTNVQLSQAGGYSVLVTNAFGSTNSASATLTVNLLPTCDPPASGLVDWWQAEGNASDSVGANNGTLNGSAGFAAGEVGQAFSFNGTNSYVSIPDSPSLDSLSNAITIEAWMKSASLGNNPDWRGLVTKGNESWRLMASVFTNTVYVALNGVTPVDLYGSRNVNDGQWHHVAATYDGSKITLYVDGTPDTSVAATGKIAQDSFPLYISGSSETPFGHTYYINGLIDEVSLYNRALSPAEIAAIYNAGSAGKCSGSPPTITTQPTNQTVFVGQTATFSVTASGTAPLHYQWSVGSSNILNATNATLTLANVQLSQASSYSVLITNAFGSTNSASATLAVNSSPTCDPPASGLVDWWRAEGDASDSVGTNNGTLNGSAGFAAGEVGQAFSFNGINSYVSVPDSPSLDSLSNAITIEAWMKSASTGNNPDWRGLVTKGNESWRLMASVFTNTVYVALNGVTPVDLYGSRNVNDGQWHHVAATYDGSKITLYVDGTLDTSVAATGKIAQDSFPLYISGNSEPPSGHTYYFNGLIDEVSLYNRALSAAEIAAIYNAGSAGKCFGTPPTITTQPTNQTVLVGQMATFSVAASGTAPLHYQWTVGSSNILNATNATLTLTNVQLSQAGNYSVLVSNTVSSAISSNAVLMVIPNYSFVWSAIPSPRFVNTPFQVTIQAMFTNAVYTNFNGSVSLTTTNGIVVIPAASDNFIQGIWTGTIKIGQTASNVVLRATDTNGLSGTANPINIVALPSLSTAVSGGNFLMSWPVIPSGFVLETATDLNGTWVQVSGSPVQIGGQNLEQVQLSNTNAFYRLRYTGP